MADKQKITDKIKELAPHGKISCTEARKIAADLNVELGEIGELCDELKIKICACELGCF